MKPRTIWDRRRQRYARRFELKQTRKPWVCLTQSFMDQLDACADDSARRVLLGIGRKSKRRLC
jgi:hypothetical protein